jgi:hypothetical protein
MPTSGTPFRPTSGWPTNRELSRRFHAPQSGQVWRAVSPVVYFDKFSRWPRRSLIIYIYAKYDMTFLPECSEQVVEEFEKHSLDHRVVVRPCWHHTMGETPYKYMDGWQLEFFADGVRLVLSAHLHKLTAPRWIRLVA